LAGITFFVKWEMGLEIEKDLQLLASGGRRAYHRNSDALDLADAGPLGSRLSFHSE
jgi:hypothetical protein